MKFKDWYDKNYRKALIIPALLVVFSIVYICFFYSANGSFFYVDISLKGGTSYTILTDYNSDQLTVDLSNDFEDYTVSEISDGSGNQKEVIVTVNEEDSERMQSKLEEILGFKLTNENSSMEHTSSSLSNTFLKQLYISIILSFFWMGAVVFIIFAKGGKKKFLVVVLNLLFAIFLGNFFFQINPILSAVIFFLFAGGMFYIYGKNSVQSVAIIFAAFSDILMTLVVVDILGVKLSTAGIVSFLMLIGYSVDTDIMLTTRLMNGKDQTDKAIAGAFKTGFSMTFTSMLAIAIALFVVYSYSSILNQIFEILLIGLAFDLLNTWIVNASVLKWVVDKKGSLEAKK